MALVWSNICNICQNVRSREPHWLYLVVLTVEKHWLSATGHRKPQPQAAKVQRQPCRLDVDCHLPSGAAPCRMAMGQCVEYTVYIYIYIHRVYIRIFYVYFLMIMYMYIYIYTHVYIYIYISNLSIISVCVCLTVAIPFPSFKHPPRLSRYFGLVLDYSSSGPIFSGIQYIGGCLFAVQMGRSEPLGSSIPPWWDDDPNFLYPFYPSLQGG